ncbi:YadA C-terminal domain-containing protein [Lelliottia wanjuensis]|uniref:YadA C-terminal domain-containing protein n=1 Tax=Lelliottia wanjuensis TaxID=3050585 RepID=A0AAP4CZM2_9ENTR|nr:MULTISPECIES: YadA C-terminal domain-containing protein [unclassified Lelliottia]MDK9362364.1 YadA C-terminal domain-containing protein [Lelliottia sp. V106_12]MDK9587207.1 YadA C-terminal domain-containing protein [Lelliottia sp. V86_10]MDK9616825.1 YadA C-terminal domain-containing protein [Lelliottia sp. V106_9]
MKLVNFRKSTIAVVVFGAFVASTCANAVTPASDVQLSTGMDLETHLNNESGRVDGLSSDMWNTEQAVKTNADDIKTNNNHIVAVEQDLNSTKNGVVVVQREVVQNASDIQANKDSIAANKTAQDTVNHGLTDVNIHQDTLISGNTTRINALENAPKPKDGAKGDKGDKGDRGLAGATTTVTKVDTATQAKVASNSVAIAETAKQSANVAKDLQDAKQFLNQQQSSSNAQFKSLKDEMDDNKKESRSGAASAIAIASMPQVEAGQSVMFSAGAGTFKDEQALSVGASFHAGTSTVIKAGVSDSTNNDFAMGAGIGIGF